jgi:hypothetical protein
MLAARLGCLLFAVTAALVASVAATASETIDANASAVVLAVNGKGEALVTYSAGGRQKRLLAWGADGANPPVRGGKQVAFSLDYSGGYGKYHTTYWKTFGHACGAYDGPPVAWFVAACKAPDGSYWALQSWQRRLPNYGAPASGRSAASELHLSHWRGPLATLAITTIRADPTQDHLFGSYVLDGGGVYGFGASSRGNPLDSFGRNVYVDTFDSAYGLGWKRENSFLTHGPGGTFCYAFGRHGGRPGGSGKKYRATVIGPGVTPDVMWTGTASGAFNAAALVKANAALAALHDPGCGPA